MAHLARLEQDDRDGHFALTSNETLSVAGDYIAGTSGDDNLQGGPGDDWISGYAGDDILDGAGGQDRMNGGEGDDHLYGGNGAEVGDKGDWIYGGGGNDAIAGWEGENRLSGGEGGQEPAADTITDFNSAEGDKFDLRPIDADTSVDGDQAFYFIGGGDFTGAAGELRVVVPDDATPQDYARIEGDIDGDGTADLVIQVHGDADHHWTANDFMM